MISSPIAVIADVVASRSHADRAGLQARIESVLAESADLSRPQEPFAATVADEFQAVYGSLTEALAGTLHVQLGLAIGVELRFGLGEGEIGSVPSHTSDRIQDGPGWWRARQAIERAEALQARQPHARTWFIGPDPAQEAVVNAYLLARDHLLATMSVRARGYARGAAQGLPQTEIAQAFGVTQSAVSQSLRRSGAMALIEGLAAFDHSGEEDT